MISRIMRCVCVCVCSILAMHGTYKETCWLEFCFILIRGPEEKEVLLHMGSFEFVIATITVSRNSVQ